MPEVRQITYDLKRLTALMLRDNEIRSGLWMILVRFNYSFTNIAPPKDQPGGPAGPALIAVVAEIGVQEVSEPGPLSVDAAEVWKEKKPGPARKRRGSAGQRAQ